MVDQVVPVRNQIIDRAAIVAIGNPAVHAAPALGADIHLGQGNDELLVMGHPVCDRFVAPILARELHKSSGLTHDQ